MTKFFSFTNILYIIAVSFIAGSYEALKSFPYLLWIEIPLFLFINVFAGTKSVRTKRRQYRVCSHGGVLLAIFCCSTAVSIVYHIILAFRTIPDDYKTFIWSAVFCVVTEAVVFWNGIICVYLTSSQLGLKLRVVGAVCGMIPVVNLIILKRIIKTVFREVEVESEREERNEKRYEETVCRTKYPLLLVHGVFFRDNRLFNYWGRIPKELELNGATVFYGNHESASSIENCANQLAERIRKITHETGCEKVNVIAHSKGGLDMRYALENLGVSHLVASLTTINTPHRGCQFADYLLGEIPEKVKNKIASTYDKTLHKLGDESPDFMAAVNNLTASFCEELDKKMPQPDGVFCQSIGSVMAKASSGSFPLNLSYHLVRFFDGENDGLVCEKAFSWGEKYTLIRPVGDKGVSHADIIDLTRQNVEGFDVREFYINLVNDLKNRGL